MQRVCLRIFVVVSSLSTLVACGDEDEPMREESVVGEWSLASQDIRNIAASTLGLTIPINNTTAPGVEEIIDTIAVFPEDATINFAEDQTYVISDPSLSETLEGTWSLDEGATELTLTGLDQASQFLGTNALTFSIQTFTESQLSLSTSVPNISFDGVDLSQIPGSEILEGATISADYQLDLQK